MSMLEKNQWLSGTILEDLLTDTFTAPHVESALNREDLVAVLPEYQQRRLERVYARQSGVKVDERHHARKPNNSHWFLDRKIKRHVRPGLPTLPAGSSYVESSVEERDYSGPIRPFVQTLVAISREGLAQLGPVVEALDQLHSFKYFSRLADNLLSAKMAIEQMDFEFVRRQDVHAKFYGVFMRSKMIKLENATDILSTSVMPTSKILPKSTLKKYMGLVRVAREIDSEMRQFVYNSAGKSANTQLARESSFDGIVKNQILFPY